MLNSFHKGCIWEVWKIRIWLFGERRLNWLQIEMSCCWWRHYEVWNLNGGLAIIWHSSLLLAMKYIENRMINCIMIVLIKCKSVYIYLQNIQLQCLKAIIEYAIEPMEFFFYKSSYATRVLRIKECVRITCYTIVYFNVYYM